MILNEFEQYCEEIRSRNEQVPDDFFRKTLEYIAATYGQVCEEFDVCSHPACNSSCGAVLTALNVLEIARDIGKPTHDDGFPF